MIHENPPLPNRPGFRLSSSLPLVLCCFFVAAVACVTGCSRREVFETTKAAESAIVGKTTRDVIGRLGAPNSVAMVGNAEDRSRRFTETWKYMRLIRDPKTRELKTLNIHFYRNRAVAVEIEK